MTLKTLALTLLSGALIACTAQVSGPSVKKVEALDASAWESSQWISAVDAPVLRGPRTNDLAADGASWFLTTVENAKTVKSARWMTTGLGVYYLFLNGEMVGEEVLKPGFTHPLKTRRSFTYDITASFAKKAGATNQLSAQVTPGWWADKVVTPHNDGMLGDKPAFRAVLELTYTDGSKECFGTDLEHWTAGVAGPVTHAGIFDGEYYDARILPGYATPEKLSKPELNTEFKGEILPSEGGEIYLRPDIALDPVKAYVWEGVTDAVESEVRDEVCYGTVAIKREFAKGETIDLNPGETLVVDFGQNAAAVPCFRFQAAAGTVLTCLPGELLNDGVGAVKRGMDGPGGSVHRDNLRMHEGMVLQYTFADSRDFVVYHPLCTFFGYRVISVTATAPVRIAAVQSIPVTSIAEWLETGTVTTGNDLVNRLISNTVWGQRSNYLSVPTDCPQRNERLGWTADTQVFTETGTFFANTDAFFHKWMRDMRDSQHSTGGFPGVAPTAQYGGEYMRLGWADAGVIVPWTVWKQFGDNAIVDENWEAMERFMTHVNDTKYDHYALADENRNYQWADWVGYEPLESCSGRAFETPETRRQAEQYWCYLGASYWAIDAGMMRDMAAATGRDAAKYAAMHETAREYLKTQFLNPDGTFKLAILNTMQTPALFALRNHLVEGEALEGMLDRLKKNFQEHDGCLQTGFLGTSILMTTLTEYGLSDIAYDLLFQRKNPSWLYSVDNGATTIWERWNSYTLEDGMGPQGMNSFNHYAYGSVCQWIWECAAGIAADPARPGFRHIIMKPVVDKRLGSLDASYQSAAGLIKSNWRFKGDELTWEFSIPEGATATVTLPGASESREYAAGSYKEVVNL
jgi:alpha-L-rhamnosidase